MKKLLFCLVLLLCSCSYTAVKIDNNLYQENSDYYNKFDWLNDKNNYDKLSIKIYNGDYLQKETTNKNVIASFYDYFKLPKVRKNYTLINNQHSTFYFMFSNDSVLNTISLVYYENEYFIEIDDFYYQLDYLPKIYDNHFITNDAFPYLANTKFYINNEYICDCDILINTLIFKLCPPRHTSFEEDYIIKSEIGDIKLLDEKHFLLNENSPDVDILLYFEVVSSLDFSYLI